MLSKFCNFLLFFIIFYLNILYAPSSGRKTPDCFNLSIEKIIAMNSQIALSTIQFCISWLDIKNKERYRNHFETIKNDLESIEKNSLLYNRAAFGIYAGVVLSFISGFLLYNADNSHDMIKYAAILATNSLGIYSFGNFINKHEENKKRVAVNIKNLLNTFAQEYEEEHEKKFTQDIQAARQNT